MLKNLFGKKNDGFYMQIDESQPTSAKPVAKVEAADQKAAPAAVEKTAPAKAEKKEVTAVAEGAIAAETSAPEAKAKSSKTSIKDKKGKDKEDKKSAAKPTAPVAPVVAPMLPVMTNFATDYLIKPSSTSGRRRPGANMKSFVTMARDVKK
jgi:hypothetical protein